MNKEEILKLVNAGYTKAEIEAMNSDQKPEVKPEVKPEEKPEVKPEEKPEEQPEVKPEKTEEKPAEASPFTPEMITEFTGAINGLSEMIKKSNMISDGYEPKSALERGEEVLASLINPPTKEKK